jgi:hypothetical protein
MTFSGAAVRRRKRRRGGRYILISECLIGVFFWTIFLVRLSGIPFLLNQVSLGGTVKDHMVNWATDIFNGSTGC